MRKKWPVFQQAQELGLQRHRQIADLIEKQCAFAGALGITQMTFAGSRERARFMPEQFAFEKIGGDCRAIDGHERCAPARYFVEEPGADFLAGPRLSGQQNGTVHVSDQTEQLFKLPHRYRYAERTGARRWGNRSQRILNPAQEVIHFKRLGQVIRRAFPHQRDGLIDFAIGGHEQERRSPSVLL